MHALIRLFGILALVFASAAGAADEVAVPPLKARVTDLTGTLNAGELASLEAELRAFEQSKASKARASASRRSAICSPRIFHGAKAMRTSCQTNR